MTAAYRVSDMTHIQIDLAFPLANAVEAAVDLADWRRYCHAIITAGREGAATEWLLVCANALGYLKGLCLARMGQTATGKILEVPLLVIATVIDEDGVRLALQARLEVLASTLGVAGPVLSA